VFEGVVGSSYDGDISIDDVFIDTKSGCRPTASCTFEDSLCLWSYVSNAFNMLRITGQQLKTIISDNSQPLVPTDTTLNTAYGHFLWISPTYYPTGQNKSTSIVSETIFTKNYLNGSCFTFSYFMTGVNPGTLNVYRKLYSLPNKSLEFTLSGNQGTLWKQAKIPLISAGANFELYIEVVFGSSAGNIAIDDIVLYEGSCSNIPTEPLPNTPFNCGEGTVITYDRVCNFIKDCPNGFDERNCGNCDFENSTCEYVDVSSGDIQWSRSRAASAINGPSSDNTLGTPYGYYMYISDNNVTVDFYDYATLQLNKFLKPCSPTCELEYYYHMLGASDDLDVYLLTDNKKYTLINELSGDFGDKWNRIIVPIGRISRPFKLEFEGLRFYDSTFDLAIDDIKLKNCEFPAPRPNGCPANYFTCSRLACIESNKVCDLTGDCGDNSDETSCENNIQCDFENGLCDWQHDDILSDFKWILNKGQTPTFGTGPKRGKYSKTTRVNTRVIILF